MNNEYSSCFVYNCLTSFSYLEIKTIFIKYTNNTIYEAD